MFTITPFQIHIRSDPHKMSLHRVCSVSVDGAGWGGGRKIHVCVDVYLKP